jgi:hypothetical protein
VAKANPNKPLIDWLRDKGYTPEEVQKILARLAAYDHKILSDAVFDSIGADGKTLEEIIREVMQDA